MRNICLILALCLAIPGCRPAVPSVDNHPGKGDAVFRYANPVLHLDYSDPDVCRVGEDYYLTASSFHCFPGLPVLHSRDLVHWRQIGAALTEYPGASFPEEDRDAFRGRVSAGNGVWAPAIRYHDGWFHIFCGDPDRGIFMVRAQDPAGPWSEPVWLLRGKGFIDPCPLWDSDGKAYLSHAAAGSRAGLKSVLFMAEMAPDGTRLLGPSRIVYDGHLTQPTIEGTKLYRRDGWCYLFAPAGGVATGWQTVLRARSPWGPFEERVVMASAVGETAGAGGVLATGAGAVPDRGAADGVAAGGLDALPLSGINGPHQGAWVETPDGRDWFLHFQDKGAYGRIVHLQPMRWTEDGWPVIGADPDGDGVGAPVAAAPLPVAAPDGHPLPAGLAVRYSLPAAPADGSGGRLSAPADGSGEASSAPAGVSGKEAANPAPAAWPGYGLPAGWQYPCIPAPAWHSVRPDGGIRLYSVMNGPAPVDFRMCPNFLMRSFFAERFIVTARLSFRPNAARKDRGETAGFLVMGDTYAGLRLTDAPDGARLEFITGPEGGDAVPLTVLPYRYDPVAAEHASPNVPPVRYIPVPEAAVWVRLDVRAKAVDGNVPEARCRISYSLDGMHYERASEDFSACAGRWIGARYGFFCNRPTEKNDAGWLDVLDLDEKEQFAPVADFVYEEADVPAFDLPDPLVGENGRPVRSVRDWERHRRPELVDLFEREMFGRAPGVPAGFHCRVLSTDPSAFGGLATRKEAGVYFTADEQAYLRLLLYVPNDRTAPAPAFLGPNFFGNHTTTDDPSVTPGDTLRYGHDLVWYPRGYHARRWPYEEILRRGYAVATFCCADVDPDYDDGFRNGVHGVFDGCSDGSPVRDPSAWGTIAAWAWGLSRALDYLKTDPDVDGSRVAVVGHSRLGKTALWAGALDTRFAMVVSNDSGCGGAALSRRRFGETVRRINTHFPHWFCPRFHDYNDCEDLLPIDQHELLALIAPRPLYVASASEDRWSDPHGEYLSLLGAAPVYALYGIEALDGSETAGGGEALGDGEPLDGRKALEGNETAGCGEAFGDGEPLDGHKALEGNAIPTVPADGSVSLSGPGAPALPPVGTDLSRGRTGYHLRPGKHDIILYDWQRYMDFADRWLR